MNFPFFYFLLKCKPRIKDKELYVKEQKMQRNFFYIHVLKELSPETFSETHNFLRNAVRKIVVQQPTLPAPNSV